MNGVVIAVLTSMAILVPLSAVAEDVVFTVPEAELLLDSEFGVKAWGPGTLASRADGPGTSVDFAFTGLGSSGTGVKDNYPVDTVYGQILPSHGNGDFSNFTGYALRVENLDDSGVSIQLSMNTGFTGASGTPSSDLSNNTYWTSSPGWTYVAPGEDVLIILDFDGAIAYEVSDNKSPHTGGGLAWPNGGVYVINAFDHAEVSAIGFEIADFSGSNPDVTVRLTPVASTAGAGERSAAPGQPEVTLSLLPNPGSAVVIRVDLNGCSQVEAAPADVAIFDVRGRRVLTLWTGLLEAFGLDLYWDGRDCNRLVCAPGLYFVVFGSAGRSMSRPVVIAR
jgi:hypothetical protein